jgi:hypothetical protein
MSSSKHKERFADVDRIAIYKKLVSIKPFFEDVEKIKRRKAAAKEAYPTERQVTLVQGAGGTWFERQNGHSATGGAAPRDPRFLLY